jgi:4-hydroxythreonine-4-phosphate dehydrogenase
MTDMPSSYPIQRLALTAGEPAGIGPDLCIQLAQKDHPYEIVVIGDRDLLQQRADLLKLPIQIKKFNPLESPVPHRKGVLTLFPSKIAEPAKCGKLNKNNSFYVLETIRLAAQGCLDGLFSAMVTAPVHKGIINDAGLDFTGHTEYIASITGGYPVMMLTTAGLRVALVTTHVPLFEVPYQITPARLTAVIEILARDLRQRFSLPHPRIIVCGLNPHAGENGHLGVEEIDTIIPTLNELRAQGLDLQGPLPADTAFTEKYLSQADAVLAMYHDQGLPVLKYKGFGEAVNVTLGLPIIRTSVDHGTALDLAGTKTANCRSLELAMQLALDMSVYNPMAF